MHYDAIIVGGGPGGATTALYAERLGLKVLLLDKKHFPRDKICGDAISGKSIVYLRELGLIDEIEKSPRVVVNHIVFSSPNQKSVKIKLIEDSFNGISSGYVCRRMVYDNILFQAAREKVETIEGFTVEDIIRPNGQLKGVRGRFEDGKEKEFTAKVLVGADGFNSVLLRKLKLYDHDPDHLLVATRAYYTGVTGLSDAIELHYIREVLPGYFWIFPLENGMANVGLGMVHSALKKKGVKLKKAHIEATETPIFLNRFQNAQLIGDIQGWNLPVGSKRRTMHGDGFILVGDAAGLIDPFTGEGIGNAMCSGKIAAQTIAEIRKGNDYSSKALNIYAEKVWKTLGGELSLAYRLQRTARFTPLVNLVVNRASKRGEVADWISAMIAGKINKRELLYPSTYIKLLLK
jgi:geranylgeranyl reductase family protein